MICGRGLAAPPPAEAPVAEAHCLVVCNRDLEDARPREESARPKRRPLWPQGKPRVSRTAGRGDHLTGTSTTSPPPRLDSHCVVRTSGDSVRARPVAAQERFGRSTCLQGWVSHSRQTGQHSAAASHESTQALIASLSRVSSTSRPFCQAKDPNNRTASTTTKVHAGAERGRDIECLRPV